MRLLAQRPWMRAESIDSAPADVIVGALRTRDARMSNISRRTATLGIAASFVSPAFARVAPVAAVADGDRWMEGLSKADRDAGWRRIPLGSRAVELHRIRSMTART